MILEPTGAFAAFSKRGWGRGGGVLFGFSKYCFSITARKCGIY